MEEKKNFIFNFFEDLTSKTFVLGIQHMFVMFGATVLVPIITGLDISVALFAAGVGTLLFHFLTKFKVPVFLGSSFAFIPGIMAIASAEGGSLAQALGGIVIAGLLYVVVSFLLRFVGTKTFHKILPPQITGPMIILIGMMLAPVAIGSASSNWIIALITFAVGVFVKVFFDSKGKKFISALPVLIALIVGYIVSLISGAAGWIEMDLSSIGSANWFGVPNFQFPEFTVNGITTMLPIAVVTMVEHFGDVLAIGNVTKKDFINDPGVKNTLLGDGLATSLSAMVGGPANTTYSENTGAVALTGVYSPVVMRIAAIFAILLSFIPKFSAVIGTIPTCVIGGISILLFGMISSIGIKNMVDAKLNLGDPKNLIIVSVILVLGLGGAEISIGPVNLSGLGLAAICGVILNLILNFNSIFRGKEETKTETES